MSMCLCGCGMPTNRLTRSEPKHGLAVGDYSRYVVGHNKRKATTKRYLQRGRGPGAAFHIQRAERALGKPLPRKARVHHADGTKNPNSPLVICEDDAYHFQLHARMRIKAKGGDPWNDRVCSDCGVAKPKTDFHRQASSYDGRQCRCKPCQRENDRGRSRHGSRADLAPEPAAGA